MVGDIVRLCVCVFCEEVEDIRTIMNTLQTTLIMETLNNKSFAAFGSISRTIQCGLGSISCFVTDVVMGISYWALALR